MRIERREFLSLTLGAGAAAGAGVASGPASGAGANATTTPAPGTWSNVLIVNALGDLDDPNPAPGAKAPSGPQAAVQGVQPLALNERAIGDAVASGLNAINITLGYVSGDMEPFEYSVAEIGQWDALLRKNSSRLLKVYNASDILLARGQHKIGVIYGFQNAAMLGTKPERVDVFANLGVRVIQLTYNPANALGDGSLAPENRGRYLMLHSDDKRRTAHHASD